MKKNLSLMAAFGLASLSFSPASSFAADGAQLAQKSGCMACHSMDKKVLGPAFKDVAVKYKGNADAPALLAKKIKDGGSGAWGPIPMPAHGAVLNDADIKTLVGWVMASN